MVGVIGMDPTSWTSPDGLVWTAHRKAFRTRAGKASYGGVGGVVADGHGWLAVGSHDDPHCQSVCGPDRALVWTSSDGASWTEIADQKSLDSGFMQAVAHGPDGFVAVGQSVGAAIWASADGQTWSAVPDSPIFVGPAGPDYGVAATGIAIRDGVSAAVAQSFLGDDAETDIVLTFWSDAGQPWSRAGMTWVATNQPSIVATPDGFLGTWAGPCPGGIWVSNDGRTWRCDAFGPGFKDFYPAAGAASDTIEVVVGVTLTESPGSSISTGRIWSRGSPS